MSKNDDFTFRLLADHITDPFFHFAVEEALVRGIDEGFSPPTLRLRQVVPSVFIGVYQNPEEDVDVAYCQEQHIPIVRRPNPGGAVYQDEGSFCFSLFFNREACFSRWSIQEPEQLYPLIGEAVKACCAYYGVAAEISPVNDVTIAGRKVYGSAQVMWYSAFVHSGTFLVHTNIQTMERVLKPSLLKYAGRGFLNVRERVINLQEAVPQKVLIDEVKQRLAFFLAQHLHLQFQPGELTSVEWSCATELYHDKYVKPEWTYRARPVYTHSVATKAQSGVIGISVAINGLTVTEISIKGDFLVPDQQLLHNFIKSCSSRLISDIPGLICTSRLPVDVKEALLKLINELEQRIHVQH